MQGLLYKSLHFIVLAFPPAYTPYNMEPKTQKIIFQTKSVGFHVFFSPGVPAYPFSDQMTPAQASRHHPVLQVDHSHCCPFDRTARSGRRLRSPALAAWGGLRSLHKAPQNGQTCKNIGKIDGMRP